MTEMPLLKKKSRDLTQRYTFLIHKDMKEILEEVKTFENVDVPELLRMFLDEKFKDKITAKRLRKAA